MESQRSRSSLFSGLLLLIVLATLGMVLVTVPAWIAGQIETVRQIGPDWLVPMGRRMRVPLILAF